MFYVETPNAVEEQVHDVTFKGHLQHQNQDKKSQENDDKSSATQQEGIQSKSFFLQKPPNPCCGVFVVQKTSCKRNIYGLGLAVCRKKEREKCNVFTCIITQTFSLYLD